MNQPATRHQRYLRNYLLDARFQLKYTLMIVSVALATGLVGGALLMSSLDKSATQSAHMVDLAGSLATESRKVSDVTKMTIKNAYADSPELAASFSAEAEKEEAKLAVRETEIRASHAKLVQMQKTTTMLVVGTFVLFLLALFAMGIYITHRVAGPVFRMKRLLSEAAAGRLVFDRGLRHGDELQDLYETFKVMVTKMRERQLVETERVKNVIQQARSKGVDPALIKELETLLGDMQTAADKSKVLTVELPAMPDMR